MSFCSVAAYSFTGIMTRPKEIAPFHMLRMDPAYPIRVDPDTTDDVWMLLLGATFDLGQARRSAQ
jgi:hypothetical protein